MKIHLKLPVSLIMLALVTSCSNKIYPVDDNKSGTGQILFLAYELKKDTILQQVHVKILHQLIKPGFTEEALQKEIKAGSVIVSFADSKGKVVKQLLFSNPFIKHYEGVNNSGELMHSEVEEKRAELLIRTIYESRIHSVTVLQIEEGLKKQVIFKHLLAPTK